MSSVNVLIDYLCVHFYHRRYASVLYISNSVCHI